MSEAVYEDAEIVRKALDVLERGMNLVEYTRFLQIMGPCEGDAAKEIVKKRKGMDVDKAYTLFLSRVRKAGK